MLKAGNHEVACGLHPPHAAHPCSKCCSGCWQDLLLVLIQAAKPRHRCCMATCIHLAQLGSGAPATGHQDLWELVADSYIQCCSFSPPQQLRVAADLVRSTAADLLTCHSLHPLCALRCTQSNAAGVLLSLVNAQLPRLLL